MICIEYVGHIGDIGHVGHVGHIRDIGHVGHIEHVGHMAVVGRCLVMGSRRCHNHPGVLTNTLKFYSIPRTNLEAGLHVLENLNHKINSRILIDIPW